MPPRFSFLTVTENMDCPFGGIESPGVIPQVDRGECEIGQGKGAANGGSGRGFRQLDSSFVTRHSSTKLARILTF